MEAILSEPGWTVRILTENAMVARDFDVIERYRDRVLLGLSVMATPQKAVVIRAVEPDASPRSERAAVLRETHERGLRTYAMLCPLLLRGSRTRLSGVGPIEFVLTGCVDDVQARRVALKVWH